MKDRKKKGVKPSGRRENFWQKKQAADSHNPVFIFFRSFLYFLEVWHKL